MIRFNNDYNHGALDSILSALTAPTLTVSRATARTSGANVPRRSSSSWFLLRTP